ncbi:putative 2-deoxyglucose-6-phosphate phosphatase [Talaromyces proteolyticus]|uniref:2-deoxyglucose-6-phosphate phosphatase n=1 Tax=Talaromyces proteolyticus TaxID=1131652 RepID=A0AAD4KHV7_9EURO|nr:putative 2-deoxyglucose-6-phosphate phosphatase [Talaromyces proteolyticus]KAH8692603.1 putative 2-deoxyglucose-6-phosphate phosphatase [Talaromyces proteolyticus]
MPIRAIVFDLLTALLDSWSLWTTAAANDSEQALTWRKRYLELTFGCGAYRPYEDLVRIAAADVGLSESAPAALIANWDKLQPWPEAKETLAQLRARGYLLGVVSNCSIELGQRAIARCGETAATFDAFVTAEEVGFYKPHPNTYRDILAALGVRPDEAVFVAGSNGDVVGAGAAGMSVVWHNRIGLPALPGSSPLIEANSLDAALSQFIA